jgi:putative acetyltransferase
MIIVQSEAEADREAIFRLTQAAFADHEHSSHTDQFIVDGLREAGALAVSLVARIDGLLAGHVAFSRVAISDGTPGWYGLGPLSVLPSRQGIGVGSTLVNAGLAALKARGARGCVLLGEPAYYGRFGFGSAPGLRLEGVPPEYFLCLVLDSSVAPPDGSVAYHDAFSAEGGAGR